MSDHITNEEAAALQAALQQLQVALNVVVLERDEARAEVERLRAALPYDWDVLQSCRESLREHMVECKRLEAEVERLRADLLRLCDQAIEKSNSAISALDV